MIDGLVTAVILEAGYQLDREAGFIGGRSRWWRWRIERPASMLIAGLRAVELVGAHLRALRGEAGADD